LYRNLLVVVVVVEDPHDYEYDNEISAAARSRFADSGTKYGQVVFALSLIEHIRNAWALSPLLPDQFLPWPRRRA
jgi:hypothetical protein